MSLPYEGDSATQNIAGIRGTNTAGGVAVNGTATGGPGGSGVNLQKNGVLGTADSNGVGVQGTSQTGTGVIATSVSGGGLFASSQSAIGVLGLSGTGIGIQGISGELFSHVAPTGDGVYGSGKNGVQGESFSATDSGVRGRNNGGGFGVYGSSMNGIGTFGEGQNFEGVRGTSHAAGHGGVVGYNDNPQNAGPAVYGESTLSGEGVRGVSHSLHGAVVAVNDYVGAGDAVYASAVGAGAHGVFCTSLNWEGVHAETQSSTSAAVAGFQSNPNGTGAGLYGESRGKGPAGWFQGDVTITGNLTSKGDISLPGSDCAENFDVSDTERVEAGTVLVIDQDGALRPCEAAYDKKVAGVVSGAGDYRPGIILDKRQVEHSRAPVALVGKVYCRADAQYSPIETGDLLTTSPTPGHAMRADDPSRAFGAVIGKALSPLAAGQGLIPILIALQ